MKIGIDARFLGPEGAGIGRYVENLLLNLEKIDQKNEYRIFLKKSNFPLFNPKEPNFKKVLADARWYGVKEQILLPPLLVREKLDLVHFPHFNIPLLYPGRFVVTVHDTIKSEFWGKSSTTKVLPVYLAKHVAYEIAIRQAVSRAKKIFTPSGYVKNKLAKDFKVKKEKIVVTHEAVDQSFIKAGRQDVGEGRSNQVLATYGVKKPFILYVGNAFPYKNLDNLLLAMKEVDPKIKLVYVSSRNAFAERFFRKGQQLGLSERIIMAGYIPDEDLMALYKLAECYIFPSFSEGFGLPALEAMAVGCPVVCSNIPVFKEVYEEAALYFNPKSPKDISDKISLVIQNQDLKNQKIGEGFEQVNKYSWKKMAEETLDVYRKVVIQ